MRISRTVAALLVALSAVCASGTPSEAAAANACALVTVAEASSAMGASSLPGKARATRRGTSCRYYSPNHTMNVFVQTIEAGDMMGAAQLGGKTIAGVGDKAIWAMGSLFVQKGSRYAQIGLYRSAKSMQTMDPQIVALGRVAASRM
jgi:hypothetical protein